MHTYDFTALNDKEFEALACDLLSEEFGVPVERFKPGKDEGVDGRWFSSSGGETILQCKHWYRSGYSALVRHLRGSERAKVERLSPTRYLLATSVPLSRKAKKEISTLFAPYVLSESDILGPQDLNRMLARHRAVEQRNYKLWLSSINQLGFLANHAILGRSSSELDLFREGATLYIQTEDHERAWAHLNERRVLILTGEPGIGKTTLARQLVLDYVRLGFEVAVLEESVSEAEGVYDEKGKQVFYFDDFLGRTFLEALKSKQDSHITNFARRIARDPNKRFILTSRTHILRQGTRLSDLLGSTQLSRSTYELRIGVLTTMDRARMLYNHMWHSNLNSAYIDELYSGRRYHQIINHPNFNPRLIAFILDADKLVDVEPREYWSYVDRNLNNPKDIWSYFFSAQLHQGSRDLAIITVLNGRKINEGDLRTAFRALREIEHAGAVHEAFDTAMHHSMRSVLDRQIDGESQQVSYTLFNPSVADYVLGYVSTADLWEHYYPRIRTPSALAQLQDIYREGFLDSNRYDQVLRSLLDAEARRPDARDIYSLELAGIIASTKTLSSKHRSFLLSWLFAPDLDVASARPIPYIRILLDWRNFAARDEIVAQAPIIYNVLYSTTIPIDEPKLLRSLTAQLVSVGLDTVSEMLRTQILVEWSQRAAYLVRSQGILGDYAHLDHLVSAHETLRMFIRDSLLLTGVELSPGELQDLCDNVSVEDIINENIELASLVEWKADSLRYRRIAEREDTAAVDDLFERDAFRLDYE